MFAQLIDPAANGGAGIAFTDRLGGVSAGAQASLNLGRSDLDDVPNLIENMTRVRRATGVGRIAAVHQVHGVAVHHAGADGRDWSGEAWIGDRLPGSARLPVADALVTSLPGLALMVRVADCLPVLFADADAAVIGAAHAGRVGLLDGVLPATVAAMKDLGARRIRAWLGPHICGQCYEVPDAMAEQAAATLPQTRATTGWGSPAIDLAAGAQAQLADLGVETASLSACTFTDPNLFSHRADGPQTGRQVGLVWLPAEPVG